ncbi:MAG: 4-(cytidine 5'-diphospho)-2-C-methyl-D-erythritol kinase [Oscillospiraceae bacterium]|nr:4-(cytidine 5'-diphospho)-2-C-methyl-D-erythritol kinase [Oscillospiraceae bacterium]
MEAAVKAYAKLNLTLDVTGAEESGYHTMRMIMQGASLCDDISIKAEKGSGEIKISSGLPYVPSDGRNIAAKAARAFFEAREITGWDLEINVEKRVPVCAGLGGGSSDAAAVLRALNEMFFQRMTPEELREMALPLGSDVPYCVEFGTMLAEGRGEVLTELTELTPCPVVICKPDFPISTPFLFKELDRRGAGRRPDTGEAVKAIERGDLKALGANMANVFESVLGRRKDEIFAVKNELKRQGALGAVMSGTGSAVFGIFGDERRAAAAANALSHRWKSVFLCETIKKLD